MGDKSQTQLLLSWF